MIQSPPCRHSRDSAATAVVVEGPVLVGLWRRRREQREGLR